MEAIDSEWMKPETTPKTEKTLVSKRRISSDWEYRRDGIETTETFELTYSDGSKSQETSSYWSHPEDDPEDY